MKRNMVLVVTAVLSMAVVLGSCAGPQKAPTEKATEIRALSDAEAAKLWDSDAPRQAIGEATIQNIPVEGGVAVVCTQAFSARLAGGGPGGVITSCGGSCKLKPGATFGQCITSGCRSNGKTCSPLVCSGGCELATSCKATKASGFAIL
jgi:hypothetical protein